MLLDSSEKFLVTIEIYGIKPHYRYLPLILGCKGHFPGGSMGPKVRAVVEFVKKTGGHASIGSLDYAEDVVSEKSGTQVFPD